jgi:hypothetical protein
MEPISDPAAKIREHIEILDEYTTQAAPWFVEYVYQTTREKLALANIEYDEERNEPPLIMYLPDTVNLLVVASGATGNEHLRSFDSVWAEFVGSGYERISDSSPINVLDVAIVWLSVGIYMPTRSPPFDILPEGPLKGASNKILMDLIDDYVEPVVNIEHDTDAVFSKKTIIQSAIQLPQRIRLGIVVQAKSLASLNLIDENYLDKSAGLTDLPAFDDELISVSYSMYLEKDGAIVPYVPSLEYAIFDAISVNEFIPFCVSNMDEMKTGKSVFSSVQNRLFKVHATKDSDLRRYHKNGWIESADSYSIILFVYIGKERELSSTTPAKDFAEVVYSYKKSTPRFNKFTVTLKTRDINVVMARLNQSLTNGYQVALVKNETDEIKQEFLVPGLELDKDLFIHLLFTDVTAATILRYNELENPWTLKKIIKFSAFLLGHMDIKIKEEDLKTSTRLVSNKGVKQAIMKGDKIVVVTVTARDNEQHGIMRFFILKLLAKYVKEYDRLLDFHNTFFGEERDRIEPLSELGTLAGGENDLPNIKLLRHADPGVWWNASYARPIAPDPDLQVKPIREDEIEKYRAMGRDVIRWPVRVVNMEDEMQTAPSIDPHTGKELIVYYTTTTDAKPHITLVPNPGPNGATHPLLPKCQQSSSDLMVNKTTWEITLYKPDNAKTTKEALKTLKILEPGRFGPVYGSIIRYLQATRMTRMGVRRSQSSFLHCVLYALEYADLHGQFRAIYTKSEADQVVEELRSLLPEFAVACMQENPDRTVEEIATELGDPSVFLDPSRHYRALEELFKVGIFTAVANENKELVVEAPPHKGFYVRSKRVHENGCVVIIKMEPQQSKVNRNYQCEILGTSNGKVTGYNFNDEVTDSLEKAVDSLTLNIMVEPSCRALQNGGQWRVVQTISAELSTENKVNLSPAFRGAVVAQKLDSLGKLRAVKISLSRLGDSEKGKEEADEGTEGNQKSGPMFWCLPQPLEPFPTAPLEEITSTPMETVQTLIEKYKGQDLRYTPKDNQLAGVWLVVEGLYVYIPVVPEPWSNKFVPVRFDSPYTPISIETETPTQEQSRLRRVMGVMLQIVKRLFAQYHLDQAKSMEYNPKSLVKTFVKTFMVVEPGIRMDVAGCPHLVPQEEFIGLLEHFATSFPTLFNSRQQIRCSSKSLLDNLTSRLYTFERVIQGEERAIYEVEERRGKTRKVFRTPYRVVGFPNYLEEFYLTVEDFTAHSKGQLIFTSKDRYMAEMKLQEQLRPVLVKKIEVEMLEKRTPYFFLYEDDNINALYLVQNVRDGDPYRAATLASYWLQNKVNLGYDCAGQIGAESVTQIQATAMKIVNPNEAIIVYYESGQAAALLSVNKEDFE